MKIIYRPHLERRLKERKIPHDYPKKIYLKSKRKYFDLGTNHYIAISRLIYSGRSRNMTISYDIIDKQIEIITIHPISDQEISNKIKSGRWIKR